MLYEKLSHEIVKCFYETYNELGSGFLESVYENSLAVVLQEHCIPFERQQDLEVYFHNTIVGQFRPDIIVDNKIILELKAVATISSMHQAQLLNYLKATGIKIGYLLNFGDKPEFKRFIFDKNHSTRKLKT